MAFADGRDLRRDLKRDARTSEIPVLAPRRSCFFTVQQPLATPSRVAQQRDCAEDRTAHSVEWRSEIGVFGVPLGAQAALRVNERGFT